MCKSLCSIVKNQKKITWDCDSEKHFLFFLIFMRINLRHTINIFWKPIMSKLFIGYQVYNSVVTIRNYEIIALKILRFAYLFKLKRSLQKSKDCSLFFCSINLLKSYFARQNLLWLPLHQSYFNCYPFFAVFRTFE